MSYGSNVLPRAGGKWKEQARKGVFSFQACLWSKDAKEGEWRERDWQLLVQLVQQVSCK